MLGEAGIEVRGVSDVTGHPEIMDGRVKTLHPAIHAGLLARRDVPGDLEAMERLGYAGIDLVAVNLYPFRETVARGADLAEAMEQVDIGGPTMLRAAAKNHAWVVPVVDPDDYPLVLEALRSGGVPHETRVRLAAKVFAHTASYDAAIAEYLEREAAKGREATSPAGEFPSSITVRLTKVQDLRYGENPDQTAAFYAEEGAPLGSLPRLSQLHGKELSFNNLLDTRAPSCGLGVGGHGSGGVRDREAHHAVRDRAGRRRRGCVPSRSRDGPGLGVRRDRRVQRAGHGRRGGGDGEHASGRCRPGFDDHALEVLRAKKNLRLIALPIEPAGKGELDYKRVRGGFVVQQRMHDVPRTSGGS